MNSEAARIARERYAAYYSRPPARFGFKDQGQPPR